ncbi:L-aspartate oxidase [Lederbergia graminis]|uniref:L-aspartate oxidase n=1 Tax=Lederbergia graminis TaxID=735518 RepID=A0ABW0LK53_9BACI
MKQADVIIIGSGIAAMQLANELRHDLNVIILTKSKLENGNSYLAQGGIAAAISKNDSPHKHVIDTLEAGRFHNDLDAVQALTKAAPSLIYHLHQEGCKFDQNNDGELLLGMEGAHSEKRIVHGGGDATGKTVMDFLASQTKPNINIIENIFVFELLTSKGKCYGAKGKYANHKVETFYANHIVIATGGCGQLYRYTSNAETVTGDGIALAYRAGAEIADMEFIQFHPTLLYTNGKTRGLISEAVRGEGARLITKYGKFIMEGVHPLGDLAPRHIVSQTIYEYIRNGEEVFLDISDVENFSSRFPTITGLCKKHGVDIQEKLIPVAPGSHFLMGGIKTDLIGSSSLQGLYAIGEVACTGVHGANRLASNSLLEGLFVGKRLADWLNTNHVKENINLDFNFYKEAGEVALPKLHEIKDSMMDNVGIIRTKVGLLKQKQWLDNFHITELLDANLEDYTTDELTKIFMLITASLITESAIQRTESRGGHYRQDYPHENDASWLRKQIIHKRNIKGDQLEQIEIKAAT